jgi:hypothetical protein
MSAIDHSNDGYNYSSLPKFDTVVISMTGDNQTSTRVLTGQSVGNVYYDGTSFQTTFAQLSAQAFLKGAPVAATFLWESSNPAVCSCDQTGLCRRAGNVQTAGYDSNGCDSLPQQESFLGGAVQITATACYPNGQASGVRCIFNLVVQAQAFRQYAATRTNPSGASGSLTGANAYSLVNSSQPPSDESS